MLNFVKYMLLIFTPAILLAGPDPVNFQEIMNDIQIRMLESWNSQQTQAQADKGKKPVFYGAFKEKPKKESPGEKGSEDLAKMLGPLLEAIAGGPEGAGACGDPAGIGTEGGGQSTFGCYGQDPDIQKMIETVKANTSTCSPNSYNKDVCSCQGNVCTKNAQESGAWCARHVTDAICHNKYHNSNKEKDKNCTNGLVNSRPEGNGDEMVQALEAQGFVNLLTSSAFPFMTKENAPIGAVYVYAASGGNSAGGTYGHVDIKTGENEHVSDFVQNGTSSMQVIGIMVKQEKFAKCVESLTPQKQEQQQASI